MARFFGKPTVFVCLTAIAAFSGQGNFVWGQVENAAAKSGDKTLEASDVTGLSGALRKLNEAATTLSTTVRDRRNGLVSRKADEHAKQLKALLDAQQLLLKLFPLAIRSEGRSADRDLIDFYKALAVVAAIENASSREEAIKVVDTTNDEAKAAVHVMIRDEIAGQVRVEMVPVATGFEIVTHDTPTADPEEVERQRKGLLPRAHHSRRLAVGLGLLPPEFKSNFEANEGM